MVNIEKYLSGIVDIDLRMFVADVVTSCNTVDRMMLELLQSSLWWLARSRHVYIEYHVCDRQTLKLASGMSSPPHQCDNLAEGSLGVVFIVVLHLPWCCYLASLRGVQPQLYAERIQ